MKIPEIKDIIFNSIKKESYGKYLQRMPSLKSERNGKILTISLTIIAAIILGIFAINPTLSTIVGLQKQLDDSRTYEQALKQKMDNLASLEQQYNKIQGDLPVVFAAVPKTPEIATLAGTIQTIISSSSAISLMNLQTLQVGVSKQALANKQYSFYNFNVAIQGNYPDLMSVLDNLINFQRILAIDSVSIVKSVTETGSSLQLNLDGGAYFKQ